MATHLTLDDLRGRAVISVTEAGPLLGFTSESAAYRAAHEWERTDGRVGIPVIRVSERRLVVPVPHLLRLLGADPPYMNGAPAGEDEGSDASASSATTTAEGPHGEHSTNRP